MAAARLNAAAPATSENSRRTWRVFSIRLTAEERAQLEEAARRRYPGASRPLATFVRWALSLGLDEVLGRRR